MAESNNSPIRILFSRECVFEGCHGCGNQLGAELYCAVGRNVVHVHALLTKDKVARAHFEVPVEDIPKLISALTQIYEANHEES